MEDMIQKHVWGLPRTRWAAREGLEKLLMTGIHSRAFKPDVSYGERDAAAAPLLGTQFITLDHLDMPRTCTAMCRTSGPEGTPKINRYKAPATRWSAS